MPTAINKHIKVQEQGCLEGLQFLFFNQVNTRKYVLQVFYFLNMLYVDNIF